MPQRSRDEILQGIDNLQKSPAHGPGAEKEAHDAARLEVLLDIRDGVNYMAASQRGFNRSNMSPEEFQKLEEPGPVK